jgi:hypothetical protein
MNLSVVGTPHQGGQIKFEFAALPGESMLRAKLDGAQNYKRFVVPVPVGIILLLVFLVYLWGSTTLFFPITYPYMSQQTLSPGQPFSLKGPASGIGGDYIKNLAYITLSLRPKYEHDLIYLELTPTNGEGKSFSFLVGFAAEFWSPFTYNINGRGISFLPMGGHYDVGLALAVDGTWCQSESLPGGTYNFSLYYQNVLPKNAWECSNANLNRAQWELAGQSIRHVQGNEQLLLTPEEIGGVKVYDHNALILYHLSSTAPTLLFYALILVLNVIGGLLTTLHSQQRVRYALAVLLWEMILAVVIVTHFFCSRMLLVIFPYLNIVLALLLLGVASLLLLRLTILYLIATMMFVIVLEDDDYENDTIYKNATYRELYGLWKSQFSRQNDWWDPVHWLLYGYHRLRLSHRSHATVMPANVAGASLSQHSHVSDSEEEEGSEDLSEATPHYCPICMLYYKHVRIVSCCGHSICECCLHGYLNRQGNGGATCPFCASVMRHAFKTTSGSVSGVRKYEDSPRAASAKKREAQARRQTTNGQSQPSPLKIGESFEGLRRKMTAFAPLDVHLNQNQMNTPSQEQKQKQAWTEAENENRLNQTPHHTPLPAAVRRTSNAVHNSASRPPLSRALLVASGDVGSDDHDEDRDDSSVNMSRAQEQGRNLRDMR